MEAPLVVDVGDVAHLLAGAEQFLGGGIPLEKGDLTDARPLVVQYRPAVFDHQGVGSPAALVPPGGDAVGEIKPGQPSGPVKWGREFERILELVDLLGVEGNPLFRQVQAEPRFVEKQLLGCFLEGCVGRRF